MVAKVFTIYPTDKEEPTRFLDRINTYMKRKLNSDWHCYKIRYNDEDHENCIERAISDNAKLILFMGHGRSDCLYGSCAKKNFSCLDMQHYYRNEKFIHSQNIYRFKNKIFFSFSCNSNVNNARGIGRKAIENGVLCFIGFGNIPTDYVKEGCPNREKFSKKAIEVFKGLVTKIIKESLYISILNNYTIDKLASLIKILTNKEMQNLLLYTNNKHKYIIVEKLFVFKNEIVIFGNRFETIL
jgi:hypothetical protein